MSLVLHPLVLSQCTCTSVCMCTTTEPPGVSNPTSSRSFSMQICLKCICVLIKCILPAPTLSFLHRSMSSGIQFFDSPTHTSVDRAMQRWPAAPIPAPANWKATTRQHLCIGHRWLYYGNIKPLLAKRYLREMGQPEITN